MTTGSQLDDIAQSFRRALLQRDTRAIQKLVQAYGKVYLAVQQELQQLAEDRNHLRRERLVRLRQQIIDALAEFAREADDIVQSLQMSGLSIGWDNAASLAATAGIRLAGDVDRLPREALSAMVGILADGSPVRSVLARMGEAVANAVIGALETSVTIGRSSARTAEEIRKIMGTSLQRALTIARTEHMRAYRYATLERYRTIDAVTGWQWRAAPSDRTCVSCLALDGHVFSLHQSFPGHPNCRCTMIPVVDGAVPDRLYGADWFAQQPASVQRRILGPTLFERYRAGDVALNDIVGIRNDPIWGRQVRQRSLADLEMMLIERAQTAEMIRRQLISESDRFVERIREISAAITRLFDRLDDRRDPDHVRRQLLDEIGELEQERTDLFRTHKQQLTNILQVHQPMQAQFIFTATHGDDWERRVRRGIDGFCSLVSGTRTAVQIIPLPSGERAYYRHQAIFLPPEVMPKTVVHELGHWLEDIHAGIRERARMFLRRRTMAETPVPLTSYNPAYSDHELTRPDQFLDPYMGKVYERDGKIYATEIVSMGLELLYADPVMLAKNDPEYFRFIVTLGRDDAIDQN